ncbi:hypothetical protein DID88_010183 [Monilinia fructigena]|uniref:CCHC-type domain-containing protein n=1 Tax=Monilinia fructigena TaxID=38457 RepID=A0A395IMS0_9HELO|nr:hypothetical protein DID88_010183 [Monilinia fructigena]
MADTPGTSSTSSPPPVLPETLRAEINNAFNQWQWIAGELSSLQDHELHSPLPLLTLTQDQQDYLNHLCNVINRTLDSLFTTQQTLERDLATERLLKTAVDNQLSTQLQLTQLLQSQLAQNPPGAPAQGGAGRRQTSKNPEPLRGEKTGLMSRQEEYTAWKQGLQICWTIDPTVFDTERKKLLHLASLIDGRARQERLIDINDIINGTSIHTTSDSFLSKLDGLYTSVDVAREASIRFDKLKMTDKMSFSAFYTQLEHLGTACHKQPREMVAAMKTKVSYNLQRLLMQDSNPCSLTDVDGWKQKFEVWSQNLRENEHLLGSKMNSSFTQPYTSPTNTSSAVPASSDPMDLDAFKTRDQQPEEERRLGLCHYCKKPGHSVWDCDAKKQADTQRAARGGPGFAGSRGGFGGHGSYRGAPAGRGNQHSNQYPNNRGGSYNRNNFQEYGSRGSYSNNNNAHTTFYPKQQLNTFQGFVETESLAPSESASNTSPHNTSTSPINDYTGKAQPPH